MTTKSDTTTRRAGVYLRISQDRTGKAAGVTRQEKDCRTLCERLGWEIVDLYRDNDISAFSGKRRPEYERLKADLEAGRIDALVSWHPDRLYRRVAELEKLLELVQRRGIRMATAQVGDVDLSTPTGQAMAQMAAVFAQLESAHKAERVKAWHRQRAEAGQPNGGQRPFGYRPDRVTIDEAEAEVIREGARRVLAGEKRFAIVTDWNRRGMPTVTGTKWSTTMLYQVLTGPRIAGYRQHNGQLHPAVWPAVIDVDMWEAVKVAFKLERARPGRPASYPLSGLVRCGLCEAKMTGNRTSRGQRQYRCNGEQSHANGCGRVARDAGRVENLVRDQVLAALTGPALVEALQARSTTGADPETLAALATLEARLKVLGGEYSVEGMWSKEEYLAHRAELEQRIADLSATFTATRGGWTHGRLPDDLAAWWDTAGNDERRELVGLVIDKILIHPAGKGGNRFNPDLVEILWRA